MEYKIIKTGSAGNALLLDGRILIDCGVPFKDIEPYANGIEVVALTHEHGDHFNKATIKRLAYEYPGIRFCVPHHMITKLAEPGLFVDKKRVDVALPRMMLGYKDATIAAFDLVHDVPNVGYMVTIGFEDALYITDTGTVDYVPDLLAKDCAYYFIEANYQEAEIQKRIIEKEMAGEFCYERRVLDTHLSEEQARAFIMRVARPDSKVLFMHGHQEKE